MLMPGEAGATASPAAEKKRKDYAFRRQFDEKPSIIPGCPVAAPAADVATMLAASGTAARTTGTARAAAAGDGTRPPNVEMWFLALLRSCSAPDELRNRRRTEGTCLKRAY